MIAISQSGRSPDIVAVVDEARRQGALTIVLTNDTDSPLAEAADHAIDLEAGPELATAATKTYTTELLAVALLSTALDPPSSSETADVARVPELMSAALTAEDERARSADAHAERQRASSSAVATATRPRASGRSSSRRWPSCGRAVLDRRLRARADGARRAGLAVLAVAPSGPALDAQLDVLGGCATSTAPQCWSSRTTPAARAIDRGLALPAGIPAGCRRSSTSCPASCTPIT